MGHLASCPADSQEMCQGQVRGLPADGSPAGSTELEGTAQESLDLRGYAFMAHRAQGEALFKITTFWVKVSFEGEERVRQRRHISGPGAALLSFTETKVQHQKRKSSPPSASDSFSMTAFHRVL